MSSQLEYVPVSLPSKGIFYEGPLTSGSVEIRKMTTREESILLSQGSRGAERFNKVLQNCTKLPEGADADDLLSTDRLAIALALRMFTFGPRYTFTYRCNYCGAMQKTTIDVKDDLDENGPDELIRKYAKDHDGAELELVEPFDVYLKDCDRHVQLRLIRGRDESIIAKRAQRMALQSNDPSDPSYLLRLAVQIVSIDGEEVPLPKAEMFVNGLTAGDSLRIRQATDERETGINLSVFPECTSCGAANEMTMPFTGEFFRPSSM